MAWYRKVKAGLVKSEITDYIGEAGHIFYNDDTGELRISDGVTPFGHPIFGGLTIAEVNQLIEDSWDDIADDITNNVINDITIDVQTIADAVIDDMVNNNQIAEPTVEVEQTIINVGTVPGTGVTSVSTPPDLKAGTQEIYLNGIRLSEGTGNDYSIDPTTIEFLNGWELFDNDVINIVYVIDN